MELHASNNNSWNNIRCVCQSHSGVWIPFSDERWLRWGELWCFNFNDSFKWHKPCLLYVGELHFQHLTWTPSGGSGKNVCLCLEKLHLLNRKNKQQWWLLHYLFLDTINEDCNKFCQEWNAHPITGKASGFSPNVIIFFIPVLIELANIWRQDIFLMGQLQQCLQWWLCWNVTSRG